MKVIPIAYDDVGSPIDDTQASFVNLTADEDIVETEEFFKDKDVNKFNLSLLQALDSIRASSAWVKHAKGDVSEWLARQSPK